MSIEWNVFDYAEYNDDDHGSEEFSIRAKGLLYSEVSADSEVVVPGGKTIKANKGDILVVIKEGKEVKVLENKELLKTVKAAIEREKAVK